MNILGIQGNFGRPEHDASAVIIQDNKLLAAVEEERFIRYKHAFGVMPEKAIKYCLDNASISINEVDILAFPRNTWHGHEHRLNWFLQYNFGGKPRNIEFVGHHLAHAASSYFYSGFDRSLILTIDMTGDGIALSVFRAEYKDIRLIHEVPFPNSLGLFMAFITQYLGFRSSQDEGKVMGLSVYGEPRIDMSKILNVGKDGYELNTQCLHPEVFKRYPEFHTRQLPMFSEYLEANLPKRRLSFEEITSDHMDVAASAQKIVEDSVFAILTKYRLPSDDYLCLAGGVAQNSVLVGKIARAGLFKEIYVTPVVGDAGSALGATVYVDVINGINHSERMTQCYLGPAYDSGHIRTMLEQNHIEYDVLDITSVIANDLAEGKIVALFQGRMEFGPRALGNRSLLANPQIDGMRAKVNTIKKREQFRPFAPSILHEYGEKLFSNYHDSPFMAFTLEATESGRKQLKEACHIDGTGRYQSVYPGSGNYRLVLEKFFQQTSVPGVLNTSLNVDGQPIANTPQQALQMFFSTDIDTLVLEDCVLRKPKRVTV